MTAAPPAPSGPAQLAEARAREILLTQPHTADLVIDSPPGAGKTGIAERLAIQGAWLHSERVMISTQTNAQAFDIALRLARGWPKLPVHLFARKGLAVPADAGSQPNLSVVHQLGELPSGPCVAVANSAKWSYARMDDEAFGLLIVDEAYQLRDASFAQIASFASRRVLVGDPGQISPVVRCDPSRWADLPDGPHVPAPQALLHRRPSSTLRMALPVSRRLPASTVEIVQPAFYPGLPFQATSGPDDRRLIAGPAAGRDPADAAIGLLESGTLGLVELEAKPTGEFDAELAAAIAATVRRLLEREAACLDRDLAGDEPVPLTPGQIGVVCGHRSQVYAVQELLGESLAGVHVETSDRYQGLEKRIVLVHHPLSGRQSLGSFQLDQGRLCVMTSRHRVGCLLFARAGLDSALGAMSPGVERILGHHGDPEHEGRQAHRQLIAQIRARGQAAPWTPAGS